MHTYVHVCMYISTSITTMPAIILALITEDTLMLHSNYTNAFNSSDRIHQLVPRCEAAG